MLARATTFTLLGIDGIRVTVEADIHTGLPSFTIVGLADAAVQESRERVRAALVNSGFEFPLRRITVNLAPADLRKAGPGFDLALAAGLLAASGQVPPDRLAGHAFCGELGLDGSVRRVRGAIAMADAARDRRVRGDRGAARERRGGGAGRRPGRGSGRHRARARGVPGGDGPPGAERRTPRDWLAADPPEGGGLRSAAGSPGAEARARGRGSRRPQRAHGGSAGQRQVDGGAAAALDHAAAQLRRGAGGDAHPQRRRRARRRRRSCSAGRFALRITRSPRRVWSAVAGRRRRARPASPSTACCSSTSCRSSRGPRSRRCASRSRRAACGSRGRSARSASRLGSCSSPRPIRVHADTRATRGANAAATRRSRPVTARSLSGPLLDRIDMILRVEQPRAQGVMAEAEPEGRATIRERVLAARARAGSGACAGARPLQRPHDPCPAAPACAISSRRPAQRSMTRTSVRVSRCAGTTECCGWRARSPTWTARTASCAATSRRPSRTGSLRPRWTARWPGCCVTACDGCLRRTALLGLLAPWIERAREPSRRRLPEVLALSDDELIEALCGKKRARGRRPLARFDPATARGTRPSRRHRGRLPARAALPACAGARRGCARRAPPDRGRRAARARCTRRRVAIVGSRRASAYGIEMARSLARDLAACGVPVVSGMASGPTPPRTQGALAGRRARRSR